MKKVTVSQYHEYFFTDETPNQSICDFIEEKAISEKKHLGLNDFYSCVFRLDVWDNDVPCIIIQGDEDFNHFDIETIELINLK
jgi:hypothetical protein